MNEYVTFHYLERQIADLIAAFPELADDDELRADVMEGETDLHSILTRLVRKSQEAAALSEAVKTQMGQLAERKKRFERRQEAMRHLMQRIMDAARARKVELPEATLSIRSVPPGVVIDDETAIPEGFLKTTVTPDRTALKLALQEGREVPGAHLSNGGETLSVRTS